MLKMDDVDRILRDDVGEHGLFPRVRQRIQPADLRHAELLEDRAVALHQGAGGLPPYPEKYLHVGNECRDQRLLVNLHPAPIGLAHGRMRAHQHAKPPAAGCWRRGGERQAAELSAGYRGDRLQAVLEQMGLVHRALRRGGPRLALLRVRQQALHLGQQRAERIAADHPVDERKIVGGHRGIHLHDLRRSGQRQFEQPRPRGGGAAVLAVAGVVAEHGQRDAAGIGEVDEGFVADRPLNGAGGDVARQRRQIHVGRTDQLEPLVGETLEQRPQRPDPVGPHRTGKEDIVIQRLVRRDGAQMQRPARAERQIMALAHVAADAGGFVGKDKIEQIGAGAVVLQHERILEQPQHHGAEGWSDPLDQFAVQALPVDADQRRMLAGGGQAHQRAVVSKDHVVAAEQRLGRALDRQRQIGVRVVRIVGVVKNGHIRPSARRVSMTCRARCA